MPRRASARVYTHAWLHAGHIIKGHRSAQAVRGSAAVLSSRARGGIEAMTCLVSPRHRVEDRPGVAFSRKIFLETDAMTCEYPAISSWRAKALRAHAAIHIMRHKPAGTGAGAAVLIPLECTFGFSGCP